VNVGPLFVDDPAAAEERATLACGHHLLLTGRGTTIVRKLFCVACDQQRDVLVYRPLDAAGNVVHWPTGLHEIP